MTVLKCKNKHWSSYSILQFSVYLLVYLSVTKIYLLCSAHTISNNGQILEYKYKKLAWLAKLEKITAHANTLLELNHPGEMCNLPDFIYDL